MRAFAVVGPGRLGLHLARRLVDRGATCVAVRSRSPVNASTRRLLPATTICDTWRHPRRWVCPPLLLVTVGDDALEQVAAQLAASFELDGRVVLHTSGLHPTAILEACRRGGAAVGSWHPLQSFPPQGTVAPVWEGTPCAIEGDPLAVESGFAVARAIGLEPWQIDPARKALYHAAAAVAGNLTHILVAAAARLLATCGLEERTALGPLVATSLAAALADPDLGALTGPIARGDHEAIETDLAALPPDLAHVYQELAELAVRHRAGRRGRNDADDIAAVAGPRRTH